MIYIAMLGWIGNQLNAPKLYWIALVLLFVIKIVQFGIDMYKKGSGL